MKQHHVKLSHILYLISVFYSINAKTLPEIEPQNFEPNPIFYRKTNMLKHPEAPSHNSFTRLLPGSDPFPAHVTPQIAQLVLKHNPLINDMLKLINHPQEILLARPQEIILVGKPGVGKTTIAAALALLASDRKIIFARATHLAGDRYQNSGIQTIDEKFSLILNSVNTSTDTYIIVLDELGALTKMCEENSNQAKATVAHLWTRLDDLRATNKVIVIATTNSLDDLPAPIRSRFEANTITIEAPTHFFRKELIAHMLAEQHNFSAKELDDISEKTDGYTIRNLEHIVKDAARIAFLRDQNTLINYKDIQKAVEDHNARQPSKMQTAILETKQYIKENATTISVITDIAYKMAMVTISIIGIAITLISCCDFTDSDDHTKED